MPDSSDSDTLSVVSIPIVAQPENYVLPKERRALAFKDVNAAVSRSSSVRLAQLQEPVSSTQHRYQDPLGPGS